MSSNNSTPNNEWIRLNVGGKVFQTTKSTLSTHPESFLARLANGNIPSEKDESGAFLIDRNYEQFGTILNYFRSGVVNFDYHEKAMKDLLCEADFYNIEPLVDEIRKAMSPTVIRSEIIFLYVHYYDKFHNDEFEIACSEKRDDYEVLQAFRDKFIGIRGNDGRYRFSISGITTDTRLEIEVILHNFGFVEESYDGKFYENDQCRTRHWKFVRTVSK